MIKTDFYRIMDYFNGFAKTAPPDIEVAVHPDALEALGLDGGTITVDGEPFTGPGKKRGVVAIYKGGKMLQFDGSVRIK